METTQPKYIIGFIIGIAVLVSIIVFVSKLAPSAPPSPYDVDSLAQCLKGKGAIFYGAFWCPHCQATKKMFGAAQSKLPYVECSTPDGQGQLQICIDKGIKGYPTWIFADGSELHGETTLDQLSQSSGCPLTLIASSTPQ